MTQMIVDDIREIQVQCPHCIDGKVEVDRHCPDYIRGGDIEAACMECETCWGSALVTPDRHRPADHAADLAEKLAAALDQVAEAGLSTNQNPSNQRTWDACIVNVQRLWFHLQDQMAGIGDWHSKGGLTRTQFQQEQLQQGAAE